MASKLHLKSELAAHNDPTRKSKKKVTCLNDKKRFSTTPKMGWAREGNVNHMLTIMSNVTFSVSEFVLNCAIRYEQRSFTISLLSIIYLVSLCGNLLVFLVIRMNHQLQTPMYLYISTLAVLDMFNSTNIIPKMMAVLLDSAVIPYGPCLLQMYMVFHLELVESLVLVFMACDRYVAVLHPLRYPSLITNKMVLISVFLSNIFGVLILTPYVVFATELHFCITNVLPYCFCDYATMVQVSCTNNAKYLIILSTTTIMFAIVPVALILFSYLSIAKAALKISSVEGKRKIFSTCLTHLLVMGLFYLPLMVSYILPGVGVKLSLEVYNTLVIVANVVPPMMNPIIYSFRNTEIKITMYRLFTGMRTSPLSDRN
ncbi:olfactory receptor 1M1-like [Erpetoichthys calabaricus]|uniref:olfactory receptor 1M1-like n=1 Tax=Erpetoichthys calabaricus TaxID=27687 RepID=UPI0022341529|nr:olfactory receptor 1M1-like [Erpetoichthys calabaricus]